MVVPGFPRCGASPPPARWGRQPIIFLFFCRKLHENERNLAGGASPATPLDPPLPFDVKSSVSRDRQENGAIKYRLPWKIDMAAKHEGVLHKEVAT